jgi:hypothetical protein
MKHVQKEIPVEALIIDPANPRFFHLKVLHGREELDQTELFDEISKDREIILLTKSIRKDGVTDPIWVKPVKGGKYLVIEGNRRTVVLKTLLEKKAEPPSGVRYDVIIANIVEKAASTEDLLVLKITLQTGKKPWGAFNEAAATNELSRVHLMADEDIADKSRISVKAVVRRIENFELFQEYAKSTGVHDPRKFSMFSQMPAKVREWIYENGGNKDTYFKLIAPDPSSGETRLRKVATKGGVRDFATILPYPKVLSAFLKDKEMTVGDALEMVKDFDIWKKFDWLKAAQKLAGQLSLLVDDDLESIKTERKAILTIKRVNKQTERILEKLGLNGT